MSTTDAPRLLKVDERVAQVAARLDAHPSARTCLSVDAADIARINAALALLREAEAR